MNITAKDLRVGNHLTWHTENGDANHPITVGEIGVSGICDEKGNGWCPISAMEGIPITEEWLERFGFVRHGDYWNKGIVELCRHAYESDDVCYRETGTPLPYVHQLQNLYFALCGEELI